MICVNLARVMCLLLDIWRQQQQVHDLRQPGTGSRAQPKLQSSTPESHFQRCSSRVSLTLASPCFRRFLLVSAGSQKVHFVQ
jgi:hypothetical protein